MGSYLASNKKNLDVPLQNTDDLQMQKIERGTIVLEKEDFDKDTAFLI